MAATRPTLVAGGVPHIDSAHIVRHIAAKLCTSGTFGVVRASDHSGVEYVRALTLPTAFASSPGVDTSLDPCLVWHPWIGFSAAV